MRRKPVALRQPVQESPGNLWELPTRAASQTMYTECLGVGLAVCILCSHENLILLRYWDLLESLNNADA